MSFRIVAIMAVGLLWSPASPRVTAQSPWGALLAAPNTPATILRLVPHSATPEVQAHLRRAMTDRSPEIRASAARVIWAARLASLLPAVREALTTETVHSAALEETRALVSLGDTSHEPAIFASWQRLGPLSAGETSLLYARARGLDGVHALRHLRQLGVTRTTQTAFLLVATQRDPSRLNSAGTAALRGENWPTLRTVFDSAEVSGLELTDELLTAALTTTTADPPRILALWHLLGLAGDVGRLRPAIETAISRGADPSDADAEMVLEFAARLLDRPPRTDLDWRELLRAPHPHAVAPLDPEALDNRRRPWFVREKLRTLLNPFDLNALGWSGEMLRIPSRSTWTPGPASPDAPTHTLSNYPTRAVNGLFSTSGCQPSNQEEARLAATLTLDPDGRVVEAMPSHVDASPACVEAGRVLLATYAAEPRRDGHPERAIAVALPLHRAFVDCASADAGPAGDGDEAPVFRIRGEDPKGIIRRGTVQFHAVVAPTGCVRHLTVIRSTDATLQWRAIRDVSSWGYSVRATDSGPQAVRTSLSFTLQYRTNY